MAQGLLNKISSGPGFMEKGGLGKESHPPSRVNIGDRYEKNLTPLPADLGGNYRIYSNKRPASN